MHLSTAATAVKEEHLGDESPEWVGAVQSIGRSAWKWLYREVHLIRGALKALRKGTGPAAAVGNALAGRVLLLFLNLTTSIMIARLLGPAARGSASAAAVWPMVFASLVGIGIPVAIRYNIRRKIDDPDQLFSTALVLATTLGSIGAAIGWILMPRFLGHYAENVILFARLMMFFTPVFTINLLLQALLEARGEFARSTSIIYLPPIGAVVLILGLYFVHLVNLFTVPLAFEIPVTCMTIVTLWRVRKSIRRPLEFRRRAALLLHFGIRAYGLDVLSTLSAQVGQLIVIGSLSAKSFGLYTVAINASRTVGVVGTSLNTILFPMASELEKRKAVALVSRAARIIFATNILVGGLFIIVMPFIIHVAYGAPYAADISLARILTLEVIIGSTVATLAQAFMATGKPGLVTSFQAIGLCTTIPLMVILIPRLGLAGAAWALLASTIFRLILVLASFPLFLKTHVPSIILTGRDVKDLRDRAQNTVLKLSA